MPRQLPCKPGAERAKRRPDIILSFRAEAPAGLLEFLIQSMPDRKRTTVKDYLKHRQVMVDGVVTTQWDTAVETGSEVRVNTSREFQTFSNPRIKIVV